MTRKAITAGVLLTMAMALAAPAGAITLRADVAGMDTSNPNWAALGIAPVGAAPSPGPCRAGTRRSS
jgi:hypothetical protein